MDKKVVASPAPVGPIGMLQQTAPLAIQVLRDLLQPDSAASPEVRLEAAKMLLQAFVSTKIGH